MPALDTPGMDSPSLKVPLDTSQRRIVIRLCGAMTADSAAQVSTQVQAALQGDDSAPLWIDMSRVDLIDSTGFSALLAAYSLAQQRGRAVVLYQVTPPVRLILELTGLDQRLNLVPTLLPPAAPEPGP
ncbi:MAG TPA: STAS domain-containing protein [Nodosilinea sp.]|nr:STAS domain-containing protein [Nodosilinea sp.]